VLQWQPTNNTTRKLMTIPPQSLAGSMLPLIVAPIRLYLRFFNYVASAKALTEALAPVTSITSEGSGIADLANRIAKEVAHATTLAVAEVRAYARDTASTARPMRPEPTPRGVAPPMPARQLARANRCMFAFPALSVPRVMHPDVPNLVN
jgi:hypothetical protein